MDRTIIVPIDGSQYSEQALVPAGVLARAIGAELVLVCAALAPVFPGEDQSDDQEKAVRKVEMYLASLADRIKKGGIEVEIAAPYLAPSSGILLEINHRCPDMVVMCTRNHSALDGWFAGSVAEEVVSHSPVPVLLVRAVSSLEPLQLGSSTSPLLVPLDGSRYAEVAIPHAIALSGVLDRDIVLLRVAEVNPLALYPPQASWQVPIEATRLTKMGAMTKWRIQAAADYLTDVEGRLHIKKGRVQSVVRLGHPAEAIQEESRARNASMIVMATHGRTGLENMIVGSLALKQVQIGSLPVYLVPPAELEKTSSGIMDKIRPGFSGE